MREKRLCNIFKTANIKTLIKTILESPYKFLLTSWKKDTLRQPIYFSRAVQFLRCFLCLNCYNFHTASTIFFNSANTRYLLLLMCVIYSKGNEAMVNSGYASVCFMINYSLKMWPCCFLYFHYSNFIMPFERKMFEKKLPFFNFFQIFTMLENFTFWQPLAVK